MEGAYMDNLEVKHILALSVVGGLGYWLYHRGAEARSNSGKVTDIRALWMPWRYASWGDKLVSLRGTQAWKAWLEKHKVSFKEKSPGDYILEAFILPEGVQTKNTKTPSEIGALVIAEFQRLYPREWLEFMTESEKAFKSATAMPSSASASSSTSTTVPATIPTSVVPEGEFVESDITMISPELTEETETSYFPMILGGTAILLGVGAGYYFFFRKS